MSITVEDLLDFVQLDENDIKEMLDLANTLLEEADKFKPLLSLVVDSIIKYSGELEPLLIAFNIAIAKKKSERFNYFIGEGFTSSEAMLLTLDSPYLIQKAMEGVKFSK